MSKSNTPAMSEDIRSLAHDFILAKKQFTSTGKSGENTHTKQKYATLLNIYNAIERHLLNNNIVVWHFNQVKDGIEYVHTRLTHQPTGQFIEDCRIQESEKPGNQGKGSANTYMKRYALLSLCAIAPEEDDDGESERSHIENKTIESFISPYQVNLLSKELDTCSNNDVLWDTIKKVSKIQHLTQLPASSFESIKSYIANNRE